jgi:hypothetical protein
VATHIRGGLSGRDRDGVWLALFLKCFMLLGDLRPGAVGIEFVFDKKHDIEKHAGAAYDKLTTALQEVMPDRYLKGMRFAPDHDGPVVQAADLLIYEWRKSLTNRLLDPSRDNRRWLPRLRAARPKGALVVYDVMKYLEEYRSMTDGAAKTQRILSGDEIRRE